MIVRECARLMGASDSFQLSGAYNDGYGAMGDGVAVTFTRLLAKHLLAPLARRHCAPRVDVRLEGVGGTVRWPVQGGP